MRPILPQTLATLDPCSVAALRELNLVLSLSLPFLYAPLVRLLAVPARRSPSEHVATTSLSLKLDQSSTAAAASTHALVMSLFPLLSWWAWMYYTDLAAVIAVIISWSYALEQRYLLSALVR